MKNKWVDSMVDMMLKQGAQQEQDDTEVEDEEEW